MLKKNFSDEKLIGLCLRVAEYSGIYLPDTRSANYKTFFSAYTAFLTFSHLSVLFFETILLIICVKSGDFETFTNCIFIACTGVTISLKFVTCLSKQEKLQKMVFMITTGKCSPRNESEKKIRLDYETLLRYKV